VTGEEPIENHPEGIEVARFRRGSVAEPFWRGIPNDVGLNRRAGSGSLGCRKVQQKVLRRPQEQVRGLQVAAEKTPVVQVAEEFGKLCRELHRSGKRYPLSLAVDEPSGQVVADESGTLSPKGQILNRVEPGMIESRTNTIKTLRIQKVFPGSDLSRQEGEDFTSVVVPFVGSQVNSQVRPGFQGAKDSIAWGH
jgi:hypothetical protein